jgi:hypothetical protein
MEVNNRILKTRCFGTPKKNSKIKKHKQYNGNKKQSYRGLEKISHSKLREIQRYGTANVNRKEIVNLICNGNALIIKQDAYAVTALVRYSSRYYVAVMDTRYLAIKTFLPDTISNFLDYVQQFIDKENANKMTLAA